MKKFFNLLNQIFSPKKNRSRLNFERPLDERITILEMLLWKYHKEGIPQDVFDRLVKNGFLRKEHDGCYGWTELSEEFGQMFNEKFTYN